MEAALGPRRVPYACRGLFPLVHTADPNSEARGAEPGAVTPVLPRAQCSPSSWGPLTWEGPLSLL